MLPQADMEGGIRFCVGGGGGGGGGVEELRMLVLGLNVRNVTFATTQLPPSYFLVKVRCCDKKPFEKYWRLFSQGYGR